VLERADRGSGEGQNGGVEDCSVFTLDETQVGDCSRLESALKIASSYVHTFFRYNDLGFGVVLAYPFSDAFLLFVYSVRRRENTVDNDASDIHFLDNFALRGNLRLVEIADRFAIDFKAAVDEATVLADDMPQILWPVDRRVDVSRKRATQTDYSDRRQTIPVLLQDRVDETAPSPRSVKTEDLL
jgi:hypothetical protein